MADDYEFRAGGSSQVPGLDRVHHGREGYLTAHQQILEVVDIEACIFEDLLPLGDDRVVSFTRFVIRAGDGTIEQPCMELHEFRDGELIRQTYWFDRAEGLRELGLD